VGRYISFLLLGMTLVSCVRSSAVTCGELTCPIGRACIEDKCVDEDIVTVCSGRGEGAACNVPEIGDGVCQGGLCLVGACGDGLINAIDACDGTNLNGRSCLDYGATDPAGLACASDCSFDATGCTSYCGDATKNAEEECDAADFGNQGCTDFGYYVGTLICTDECTINIGDCSGQCGDGVVDDFETCDGTQFNGQTCESAGYLGDVLPIACSSTCSIAPSSCTCGGELCAKTTQRCVLTGGIYQCQSV